MNVLDLFVKYNMEYTIYRLIPLVSTEMHYCSVYM
jgi:hypothetical protein